MTETTVLPSRRRFDLVHPVRPSTMLLFAGLGAAVLVCNQLGTAELGASESILPFDTNVMLTASVVFMIVIEIVVRLRRHHQLDLQDSATSMTIGLGYLGIQVLAGKTVAFGVYLWVFEHLRLFDLPWQNPLVWLGYWIVGDFFSYWIHRAEHRVRLLWCSHQVHHSSEDYSFTTAIRMPWTEMAYKPITGLWAPLLGFPPIIYPVMGAVSLMIGQLQHTELIGRLGWLDKVLMTPSNHRVHHASNPRYLDKNFGGHTAIFDHLFGTYEPELDDEKPVYGLTHPVAAKTPLALVAGGFPALFTDLRAATGFRHRVALVAGPPSAAACALR